MDLRLTGKRALVTAASRGLGRASALSLAREGAHVALASRDKAELETVAGTIADEGKGKAFVQPMDVRDPESVRTGVEAVAKHLGGLDILVANGPGPASGPFESMALEDWREALEMTVLPMVSLARAAVPVMRQGGGGHVVFVTTIGVKTVQPDMVLSNSTRLAILGLAKSMALELAGDGIRVNTICPGPIATDRMTQLISDTAARDGLSIEDAQAVWLDEVPMKAMGRPEDFGDLVAVLCSDVASYVTGAALAVDGGKSRAY